MLTTPTPRRPQTITEDHNPSSTVKQVRRYEALLSIVDLKRNEGRRRLTAWRDFDRVWEHNTFKGAQP